MNTIGAARISKTWDTALGRGKDVCLKINVVIAHSENVYSLQKEGILQGFRSLKIQTEVPIATFVQSNNSALLRQKMIG